MISSRTPKPPKKIVAATVKPVVGTMYPTPYDQPCRAREKAKLGDLAGLNPVRGQPGAPQTRCVVQPAPLAFP